MKKSFIYLFALMAISLVLATCSKNPTDPAEFGNKTSCYIVNLGSSGSSLQSANLDSKIKEILTTHNIPLSALKCTYRNVLKGFAAYLTDEQVASLKSDKMIKNIEKDQVFKLVDGIDAGKGKPTPPPTDNWGVTSVKGNIYGTTDIGVVWVIDTGIDFENTELNVDETLSKSFVSKKPTADDDNGHGSHCGGIIGCSNGLIGVCPGASLIAIKVLNSKGDGSTSDIISGIDYVASNLIKDWTGSLKINVVNMSFGGNKSTELDNAVIALANKGAYISIAAGNSKKNAANYSPSRVEADRVFTISAHDVNDNFASFSNYGNPPIDFAAPGVNILSCDNKGNYVVMSGTSMAAPHAAAVILGSWGSTYWLRTVKNDRDNTPDKIIQFNTGGGGGD